MSFNYTKINEKIISVSLPENVLGGEETILLTSLFNKLAETKDENLKAFVLDLTNVNVMNSSGLGMVASALATSKKHNIELLLVGANPKIEKLLVMTGLNKVFKNYNSINDILI